MFHLHVDMVFGWNSVNSVLMMCFLLDFDWKQDARLRMTLTNLCDSRRGEGLEGSLASMEALLQFHSRAVLWCPMASGTATFRQGTSENGEFAIYFTNVLAIFVPCRYNHILTFDLPRPWFEANMQTVNYKSIYIYILYSCNYCIICLVKFTWVFMMPRGINLDHTWLQWFRRDLWIHRIDEDSQWAWQMESLPKLQVH